MERSRTLQIEMSVCGIELKYILYIYRILLVLTLRSNGKVRHKSSFTFINTLFSGFCSKHDTYVYIMCTNVTNH